MADRDITLGSDEIAMSDDNNRATGLGVTELDGGIRRIRTNMRGGTQVAPDPNRQYKTYQFTLPNDTEYADGETLNIGYDLAVEYGYDTSIYRVVATSGFLVTSHDIQFKFNATDNDELCMRVLQWGNLFELGLGELGIDYMYFANRANSGSEGSALVFVFVSG